VAKPDIAKESREREPALPKRPTRTPPPAVSMERAPVARSARSAVNLVTQRAMRHPTAATSRAFAMRQAQQSFGNRALASQFSRAPAGPLQADAAVLQAETPCGPLDHGARALMESKTGHDFGDVRVHTDERAAESADALNANAFAFGRDIYFGAGRYNPSSREGLRLVAHELTHTMQQGRARLPSPSDAIPVSSPGEPAELEAERVAEAVMEGGGEIARAPSSEIAGNLISRDAVASPPPELYAAEYVSGYSDRIAAALATRMKAVELGTGSAYASWVGGSAHAFMEAAWNVGPLNLLETLRPLMQPVEAERAVDQGRDLHVNVSEEGVAEQTSHGKDAYFPDVAVELANVLTAQLNRSLQRVTPRYIARRYQLKLKQPRKPANPAVPEPSAADILPAHPMDRLVIDTLCRGGKVDIDYDRFAKDRPPVEDAGKLQTVTFDFLANKGAWFWLRVNEPRDATTEEVANALYGDPAQAFRMVNATPLFGFTEIALLLPAHREKLEEMSADPAATPSAFYPGADIVLTGFEPPGVDPAAEVLASPFADEASLNQAGKLKAPAGSTKEKVLDNMRLSFEVLDAMIPEAKVFDSDGPVVTARDAVQEKRTRLSKADAREVLRWASQSAEQQRIVGMASSGLAIAVAQLDQMLAADKKTDARELAGSAKASLFEVANLYVSAAAESLLVSSAAAKVAAADERSRAFSVELMEGVLRNVSHEIETAEKDKTGEKEGGNEQEFGISSLRTRQEELRKRLGAAREAILRNPDQVSDVMEKIHDDVADLQSEVAIVSNLDSIDAAQKALWDSKDFLSDVWAQEWELRGGYLNEVNAWRELWSKVYAAWKKGDHVEAMKGFRTLITQDGYRTVFERTARYVKDAAAWAIVARILTLIAITALTMGIGTYAFGFAATAWGGAAAAGELTAGAATAGLIGATVAEAGTFTVLNTLLLEPNATWKGFLGEFGWNLLMFGSLRKLSMLYRGAAAIKAAVAAGRTTLVAAGDMTIAYATLNVANIARAEIESRIAQKGNLSAAEVETILMQSAAMFVGMAVLGRVSEPMMSEIAASGSTAGARVRLINAQRARLTVYAEELSVKGDVAKARRLMVEDRAELQSEIDFYDQISLTPEVLAKAGYSPEQIFSLRLLGQQQVAEIGVADAMSGATKLGGNEYALPKAELAHAVEAYRTAGAKVDPLRQEGDNETWSVKPVNGPLIRLITLMPDQSVTQLAQIRAGLSPDAQEAFDRVVGFAITPKSALDRINELAKSPLGLDTAVRQAAHKLPVQGTVPGLYSGVNLAKQQGPWTFTTSKNEVIRPDGSLEVDYNTAVTLRMPDGTIYAGHVSRSVIVRPNSSGGYDADLSMNAASLDDIPKELRWVTEGAVPLVEGRGTPLQTYITLMQMRMAGVQLGQIKDAHLSFIVNARTCCELEAMRRQFGHGVRPEQLPSKLIERTQSGTYGMTNVVQAGGKVKGMKLEGGGESTVDHVVHGTDMDDDVKLRELGLLRTDKILYGFNIVIDIEPPQTTPTAPPTGTK